MSPWGAPQLWCILRDAQLGLECTFAAPTAIHQVRPRYPTIFQSMTGPFKRGGPGAPGGEGGPRQWKRHLAYLDRKTIA